MPPDKAFPEELSFLESHGLIEMDKNQIRLTPAGEIWGQNVCVEFCSKPWKEKVMPKDVS